MYVVPCLGTLSHPSQAGLYLLIRHIRPRDLVRDPYLSVAQPSVISESKEGIQVGIIPQTVHGLNGCGWLQQMAPDPWQYVWVACHARSLLLTDHQFGIHTAGLSVGLTFPSSPKAQKPCDRGHATA